MGRKKRETFEAPKRPLWQKIVIGIIFIPILVFAFLYILGSIAGPTEFEQESNQSSLESESEPSQEELDNKLKKEAVEVDFVTANADQYEEGTKLFAKGTVESIIDDGSAFPTILFSTKSGDGYGMYEVQIFDLDAELKVGDEITIYGIYKGNNDMSMPILQSSYIEE
jgi:hypothetical protein